MLLPTGDSAVAEARRYARGWTAAQRIAPAVTDDVDLVVDELVTNAVTHAEPPYSVALSSVNGMIRGEVNDGSTAQPIPDDNPSHLGGLGLRIVNSLTSRWGSIPADDGKMVWFEIDPTDSTPFA